MLIIISTCITSHKTCPIRGYNVLLIFNINILVVDFLWKQETENICIVCLRKQHEKCNLYF